MILLQATDTSGLTTLYGGGNPDPRVRLNNDNMSDTMVRNTWIAIGIVAVILVFRGWMVMRRRRG